MALPNIEAYWQPEVLPFSNCTVNAWAPPGPETQLGTLSFSFEQLTWRIHTSKWQRLSAEFDKNQAEAYSLAPPGPTRNHSTGRVSDRSSGLGPVHGRPAPTIVV
jgi:hypothetical protein